MNKIVVTMYFLIFIIFLSLPGWCILPPVEASDLNEQGSDSLVRCPKTIQELTPYQQPVHGSLIGFYKQDDGWRVGYVWSHSYCVQHSLRGKEFFPAKHQDRVPHQPYEERYSYYPMNSDGTFQRTLDATQSIVFSTGTSDLRDDKTSGIIYRLEWPCVSRNNEQASLREETQIRVTLSAFQKIEGVIRYVFIPPEKVKAQANNIDIPAYLYLVEVKNKQLEQASYKLVPSNLPIESLN